MVTGPGHQATVAQPVQQAIEAGQAVQHAELLADPLPQILGPSHAGVGILGLLVEVGLDLLFLVGRQLPAVAAGASFGQSGQAAGVVASHPDLDDPPRDAEDLGDLRGRAALLGQQDHLQPQQQAGVGLFAHQVLQLQLTVMLGHMHGLSSLNSPASHTSESSAT